MKLEYKDKLIEKVELAILQDEILVLKYEQIKSTRTKKEEIAQLDILIEGKKKEIEFNKEYVKFASTL